MADPIDILIDNLVETFKAIEKFLLLGLTASLVLIVLAVTNRGLVGVQKIMFADMNAPAVLVAAVALGAYWASGAFAAFYFVTRTHIVKRLREHDPGVVDALLTYPSVASRLGVPQILALAAVGGGGMVALLLMYTSTHAIQEVLLTVVVFGIIGGPYLVLVAMAFWTAVAERARPDREGG
jgi:hypothetical protein